MQVVEWEARGELSNVPFTAHEVRIKPRMLSSEPIQRLVTRVAAVAPNAREIFVWSCEEEPKSARRREPQTLRLYVRQGKLLWIVLG
jgi:hypothetical protein